MNLHQFRFVYEAARRELNLTETAKALHTSQPGVSKAILELEEELGVDIFVRYGKRLKAVTEPGRQIIDAVGVILGEVENLKRIGKEFTQQDSGVLSIATTHTQARYVLPTPVAGLRKQFPKVSISLHQGSPEQVAQMVLNNIADVGLATEALAQHDGLVTLPCYDWQHMLIMPNGHPLARAEVLTLEGMAAHDLVSYHPDFAGRRRIDQAFAQRHLQPRVVMEAIDSDVIKTYVRLGLGLGIVAEMAVLDDPLFAGQTGVLVARPVGQLFGRNTARMAFKRNAFLRNYVYVFAQLVSERLDKQAILRAMTGQVDSAVDYQL
jgi:LysR family transcriptional regulator, cys regulon transcriptional activator